MYIKNTNVHEVYFKNKVLLVNLNNGQEQVENILKF